MAVRVIVPQPISHCAKYFGDAVFPRDLPGEFGKFREALVQTAQRFPQEFQVLLSSMRWVPGGKFDLRHGESSDYSSTLSSCPAVLSRSSCACWRRKLASR